MPREMVILPASNDDEEEDLDRVPTLPMPAVSKRDRKNKTDIDENVVDDIEIVIE
jgi:hypothetical protein